MCVTHVYTDRYPNGREVEFRQTTNCERGSQGRPCSKLSTLENPVRNIQFWEPTTECMMTKYLHSQNSRQSTLKVADPLRTKPKLKDKIIDVGKPDPAPSSRVRDPELNAEKSRNVARSLDMTREVAGSQDTAQEADRLQNIAREVEMLQDMARKVARSQYMTQEIARLQEMVREVARSLEMTQEVASSQKIAQEISELFRKERERFDRADRFDKAKSTLQPGESRFCDAAPTNHSTCTDDYCEISGSFPQHVSYVATGSSEYTGSSLRYYDTQESSEQGSNPYIRDGYAQIVHVHKEDGSVIAANLFMDSGNDAYNLISEAAARSLDVRPKGPPATISAIDGTAIETSGEFELRFSGPSTGPGHKPYIYREMFRSVPSIPDGYDLVMTQKFLNSVSAPPPALMIRAGRHVYLKAEARERKRQAEEELRRQREERARDQEAERRARYEALERQRLTEATSQRRD